MDDEKYTIPYEQDLNEGMVQILSKARENKHAQAPKKSSDAAATIKAFTERGGHYFVNQDLAAAFLEKNRTAEMVVYSERVVYQEQGKYFVAHHFVDVHNKIEFTHYTELKKLENINNLEKEINEICTHTEELIRKRIKEYEELGTEESNAKDIYQAGKLEHAQTSLERKGIGATCLYMTPRGNVHVFQNLPNGEVDYKRIPFDQPLTSQIEEITRENMKRPSTRSVQYEQIKAEKKVADSEEKALNALSPNKRDFRIWLINPQNPHGPCGFAYSDGKGGEPIITIIKTEQDLLKEITLKHGVAGLQTVRMAERYEVGDLIKLKAQFLEFCDPKDRGAKFSDLPTIYKKLARLNHPDRASAENVEKFKEMSLKYKELIDLIMNRISASNLQERLEILDTEIQKRK